MIEQKLVVAALTRGARVLSKRVVPFPHDFVLLARDGVALGELSKETVQDLVDDKLLAGRPLDALWDVIEYVVSSRVGVEARALSYWPRGFGFCGHCGAVLKLPHGSTLANRHGHTKGEHGLPPCEGTGKPLADVIRPLGEVARVA